MRYLLRILVLFLPIANAAQDVPAAVAKESAWMVYFDSLDTEPLIGRRADSVLQYMPGAYKSLQVSLAKGSRYEAVLRVSYPNGIWVDLLVSRLQYTNPNGMSRKKKLRQFKRETIDAIEIRNSLACIKGCD